MPQFLVREEADRDVDDIADYIGNRNVSAGHRFIEEVWREFAFLSKNPRAGTLRFRIPRRFHGLRSWPVKGFKNYLIFYLPTPDGIEIVRVLHGARNIKRIIRGS